MSKYCFGNWKLNKTPKEAKEFLDKLKTLVSGDDHSHMALFPPAFLAGVFSDQQEVLWGGQNVYFEEKGAFTGENSADTLKAMGASYVLIGHSERRSLFKEEDEGVYKKTKLALEKSLKPVVCIGESLEERESGEIFKVLSCQIDEGLKDLDRESLIVAYEPVWAIGTGKTATPKEVLEVHSWLRKKLATDKTPLLYGGSVKAENASDLYKIKDVNGFLVGGASLNADSFYQIFKEMKD